MNTVPWQELAGQLRPFVARRVAPPDVDDVIQDVFLRMQRGLPGLRDDERLGAWLFQVARSAIADHGRSRARHPLPARPPEDDAPAEVEEDDRQVARALSGCVAPFVARLRSPYREAITLVELEGLTAREAAEMAGVSLAAMKSRVLRGRIMLRELIEDCCEIALDARRKVTDVRPRSCDPGRC